MVTIKLFGVLRLKCGIKVIEADVKNVKEACRLLSEKTQFPEKEFKQCIFTVNGKSVKYSSRLKPGDELMLMAPAAGG